MGMRGGNLRCLIGRGEDKAPENSFFWLNVRRRMIWKGEELKIGKGVGLKL